MKRASSREQLFVRDANPIGSDTICSLWLKFSLATFTPPNLTNRTCIPPQKNRPSERRSKCEIKVTVRFSIPQM